MDLSRSPTLQRKPGLFGRNRTLALLLLVPALWCATAQGDLFPLYLFKVQDLAVVGGLIMLLALTDIWKPRTHLPASAPAPRVAAIGGVGLALLLWWGCHALMGDYPISRDEVMVDFDMAVFAKGHLAEPLAASWRAFARDLVPAFLLNEELPRGLVSSYLPGNAALRQLFSFVADPALMNPLLVLCGGLALLDIARRQFERHAATIWVVLLVYGLSAQMLVNAMTSYAMTGHMAFNLIWLAAFLRGTKRGHMLAIAAGFVATGLHQLVFHPLFAAPFLLWRLRQGQWRLVFAYGAAYAAICGWWMAYPALAALQTGVAQHAGASQANFLADRVWPLLVQRDPMTVPYMTLNLLRFVAWQNLALLPLLAAAAPLAWRVRSLAAPMIWGIVGALMFIAFILPFQGHGWGYRYMHPFLGSFALLAGFGYQRLVAERGRAVDGMVVLLSAATLFGSIPWLLSRAQAFVAPHVALERLLARQSGDFVLIDTDDARFDPLLGWQPNAIDQVRNQPDLSNHPLRLSSRLLSHERLSQLCERGRITLVTRADMHAIGFAPLAPVASPRFEALIATVKGRPCLR